MKKLLLIVSIFVYYSIKAQWQPTNGPYGGNISCIALKGTDIFAGT